MFSSSLFFAFAIISSSLFLAVNGSPRVEPLVQTNVGTIRGLVADDGDYSMYMGIPYGKVDEENPFGPSKPYPAFQDIFDAHDDSAICPQIDDDSLTFVGSLDCLHLNVYVPKSASPSNPLPVLVWMYGGGWVVGFAGRYLYGPKYLVRHDVILVSLNYRLGPYGFMCPGTPEYPGNQGFKDQVLALRWLKENIEFFGGHADEITIFGESAGSVSTEYHILTDKDKLFNKAIMESGTLLYPGNLKKPNQSPVFTLAKNLGFETDNLTKAITFISTFDPKLVIMASPNTGSPVDKNPFTPCLEKEFAELEIPQTTNIKIMIGYNSDEMGSNSFGLSDNPVQDIHDKLSLGFDFDEDKLNDMAGVVSNFYLGDIELEYKDFLSDYRFFHPTLRTIESFVQSGVKEVYHYMFSYVGRRNLMKQIQNSTTGGAFHADELGYLFDVSYWPEDPAPEDQLILDRMTTMWANFVKYGNPTPETTELLPVKWEPITLHSPVNYLSIDSELSMETRPFNQRMVFWDQFYKANQQFQKNYVQIKSN